jgi:phage N-6-adenine-methyltransferase
MRPTLFDPDPADVADTTDDWYTPPWLFQAAGLVFDMDVAAPIDPTRRTCPARRYLTPVEDGLTHPWSGIIWCNPPYSNPGPWVDRFAAHAQGGLLLVPAALSAWLGTVVACADALTIAFCEFIRPDGRRDKPRGISLVLAARSGICIEALRQVAAVDKHARGAYLVRPS